MNLEDYINKVLNDNKFNFINGFILTSKEIEILDKFNIDYKNCHSLKEVLYKIEQLEIFDPLLEEVSLSISDRDYYENTNK